MADAKPWQWPGKSWLDIRNAQTRSMVAVRLGRAVARGCDGVEPDNMDGCANASGLSLAEQDQLDANLLLASAAHQRGLNVGLENAVGLNTAAPELRLGPWRRVRDLPRVRKRPTVCCRGERTLRQRSVAACVFACP